MLASLHIHPEQANDLLGVDTLTIDPPIPLQEFVDSFGNRFSRFVMPAGVVRLRSDAMLHHSGEPDEVVPTATQLPVEALPVEALPFLLSSRYCEVDLLADRTWELFSHTLPGWSRVQAICDWVHQNVQYGYEFSRPTKTARDVLEERAGVCRDFQHLAITFCRALNIPARYASGYLGDIRIPPVPIAMDFHAWFEVYLEGPYGGKWYPFDARHNTPRIGRVLMARGRDATDAALTTSFGNTTLTGFKVWADEVAESSDR
jgi:transglutaminase-like putative cysteine protease